MVNATQGPHATTKGGDRSLPALGFRLALPSYSEPGREALIPPGEVAPI